MYMAVAADHAQKTGDPIVQNERFDQERHFDRGNSKTVCTKRHDDLGCWKRLTCQKCGRKGPPADKCYYVCSVSKNIHDIGKCPMEQLNNLIGQWYVRIELTGMLPEQAEKMLN